TINRSRASTLFLWVRIPILTGQHRQDRNPNPQVWRSRSTTPTSRDASHLTACSFNVAFALAFLPILCANCEVVVAHSQPQWQTREGIVRPEARHGLFLHAPQRRDRDVSHRRGRGGPRRTGAYDSLPTQLKMAPETVGVSAKQVPFLVSAGGAWALSPDL